ncbi:MAG: S8 family serine peptidase [Deltaproteobacteria bacterium]|nr:S8 family serine peptidase [Deltaproteobacteria bacterium]
MPYWFWLLSGWLAACGSIETRKDGKEGEARKGSYLLAFDRTPWMGRGWGHGDSQSLGFALARKFGDDFRIRSFELLSVLDAGDGAVMQPLAIVQVDVWKEEDAELLLTQWEGARALVFWEPNWLSRLSGPPVFRLDRYVEADSRWWADGIKLVPALHELEVFSLAGLPLVSPVVAVLDSGIDYEHPALVGRVWEHPHPESSLCKGGRYGCNTASPREGTLGDGTVFPLGAPGPGRPCTGRRGDLGEGDCAHGTHVAGVIAGNPAEGVMGVCPTCRVMNLRVVESIEGEARISDGAILRALAYLSSFQTAEGKNLVRVVNLSFGKYQKGQAVSLYIKYISQLRDGILVIGAAGNEDSQRRVYPAAHPLALGVAGLGASGRKASYSNFGPWVDIAAPAGESQEGFEFLIDSSFPGGGISYSQGTSMAVPIVSGVAGLVLSAYPGLSLAALKNLLISTADTRIYGEGYAGGYNFRNYLVQVDHKNVPLLGKGMVDAWTALRKAAQSNDRPLRLSGEERRVELKCGSIGGADVFDSLKEVLFYFMLPLLWAFVSWVSDKGRWHSLRSKCGRLLQRRTVTE